MRAYADWPRFFKRYRPQPRPPLGTYIRRLKTQLDQLDERNTDEFYASRIMACNVSSSEPHVCKSLRSKDCEKIFNELLVKNERSFERSLAQDRSNPFTEKESFNDNDDSSDKRIAKDKSWNKEMQSLHAAEYSRRTVSPERRPSPLKRKSETRKSSRSRNERDANDLSWLPMYSKSSKTYHLIIGIVIVVILAYMLRFSMSEESPQRTTDNIDLILCNSMEKIKTKFRNQESNIWNDISSAINEMVSRTPKVPSIILLYANETSTMNCLATEIAHVSSAVLSTDVPLQLNPENFGDDPGKIIAELNERLPSKKVVIIRNILDINVKAIRALHNLCDRVNPLVGEAIYILTMQTSDYESSKKPLAFVEGQMYHKLSRNIDQDILAALIARVTDGAIISVQPEPHLRYCT